MSGVESGKRTPLDLTSEVIGGNETVGCIVGGRGTEVIGDGKRTRREARDRRMSMVLYARKEHCVRPPLNQYETQCGKA